MNFAKELLSAVSIQATAGEESIQANASVMSQDEKELPRIAAAKRIERSTAEQGLQLALEYQLLSKWTNYLVIAEREQKARELPELHQVPQMLAAGWGGVGAPQFLPMMASLDMSSSRVSFDFMMDMDDWDDDIPVGLDAPTPMSIGETVSMESEGMAQNRSHDHCTPREFVAQMESAISKLLQISEMPTTIKELYSWGLHSQHSISLLMLVNDGNDEAKVIIAYLYALSESSIGHLFGRAIKRAILKSWKDAAPGTSLDIAMVKLSANITADTWAFEHD